MTYDVVIVGGGPAGLAAALTLGRGRKRVLLCDAGPRRNGKAERVYNFVTRDGTPPDEFREVARKQLERYPSIELRDEAVSSIGGERGAFVVQVGDKAANARVVLLCTGMRDEMLPIEGFSALWGHAIFQCPYCHGWEAQDQRWGLLAGATEQLEFALLCRGWTDKMTVFTNGRLEVSESWQQRLAAAAIGLETRPLARLLAKGDHLDSVELAGGARVKCDILLAHPPQRQVKLVAALAAERDLSLDEHNYVQVDPMTQQTSVPGLYAAGDLTTRMQAAISGAAKGMMAAAMINRELMLAQFSAKVQPDGGA